MSLSHFLDHQSEQLKQARKVFVGYSGGLDSTVLLHSVVELIGSDKVCALHANHQLQPDSEQWHLHCSEQAKSLGVEFRDARLLVSNKGQGIENEARKLRYEFFREQLEGGDILVLGHHVDDQAETLLYRLFRGSGARGLSAIPVKRAEGLGHLIRPLLNTSREKLRDCAVEAKLEWIEDPSNFDIGYDRNYIRSKVLPSILERWPAAKTTLARATANMTSASLLLDEYGDELLTRCEWQKSRWGYSFDISRFISLSSAAQNHLLASAFRKLNLNEFDSGYLDKVLKILSSAEDKSPAIEIGKSELRRFDSRLYLMDSPASSFDQKLRLSWTGGEPIRVAGCGDLSALNSYKGPELEISLRQSGERCKPSGRNRSQSLKKLMQEYKLEPWLRARTPIIWRNGEILALAGVFSCSPELEVPEFNWDLC